MQFRRPYIDQSPVQRNRRFQFPFLLRRFASLLITMVTIKFFSAQQVTLNGQLIRRPFPAVLHWRIVTVLQAWRNLYRQAGRRR